ncbi:Metalloenzyme, LuxS/M16 peptidase-like protein, partial [Ochromonadaceae sp. CCMP2298]
DCAGLYFDLTLSKAGFQVDVQGYGHKLPTLLASILDETQHMCAQGVGLDLFERMKERALRGFKNFLFWQPYYHAIVGSLTCMEEVRFSPPEKHAALTAATLQDFTAFLHSLVQKMRAVLLVHGNATAEEASDLTSLVCEKMPFSALPPAQLPTRRVVQLGVGVGAGAGAGGLEGIMGGCMGGGSYLYRQHAALNNPEELNSAVENVYFVGLAHGSVAGGVTGADASLPQVQQEAMLELLAHMMSEPAFDQLRTKEQLGYIVFTGTKRLGQVLGLQLIAQSSHKNPDFLDRRVEVFLTTYRAQLGAMGEAEFEENVTAVVEKLLERPKNVDQEGEQLWAEVKSGTYWFARKTVLAGVLRGEGGVGGATLPALLSFFDRFVQASPLRSKFSSQFYGKGTRYVRAEEGVELVGEPSAFRRSHSLMKVPAFAPC